MAVTVAALAWAAAYLAFDVKPEQVSKYFHQLTTKENQGTLIGKGNQAPESRVTHHQSDGKGPPTEAKDEVPETIPKWLEESNSVPEVSSCLSSISSVVHFYALFGHFFLGFWRQIELHFL